MMEKSYDSRQERESISLKTFTCMFSRLTSPWRVMLSVAKHLSYGARDSSVAANAPSHRPEAVSLRESDIILVLEKAMAKGYRYLEINSELKYDKYTLNRTAYFMVVTIIRNYLLYSSTYLSLGITPH